MNRPEQVRTIINWISEDPTILDTVKQVWEIINPAPSSNLLHVSLPWCGRCESYHHPEIPCIQESIPITTAAITTPTTPTEVERTYTRPNIGFTARILRYLYTGPCRKDQLQSILGITEPAGFNALLHNPIGRGEIKEHDGVLSLTEAGRKKVEYLVQHPTMLKLGKKLETL